MSENPETLQQLEARAQKISDEVMAEIDKNDNISDEDFDRAVFLELIEMASRLRSRLLTTRT